MKCNKKKTILFIILVLITMNVYASVSAEGWQLQNTGTIYNSESPVLIRNGFLYIFKTGGYEIAPVDKYGSLGNNQIVVNGLNSGYQGSSIATTEYLAITAGGILGTEVPLKSVVRIISFKTDGSVDTVRTSNYSIQTARIYHASLVVNNRLYIMGGIYKDSNLNEQYTSSVEVGTINSDSSIGPFLSTSSFNNISGRVYLSWNSGDTIYCYGNSGNYTDPKCSIERSIISMDGSLGSWTTLQGPIYLCGPSVITNQNTLFTVQDYRDSGYNNCFKTQIDDTLKNLNWGFPAHTIKPRTGASLVTWNRFVYLIGGNDPDSGYSVYSAEMYDPNLTATELYDDHIVSTSVEKSIVFDNN